MIFPEVEPEQWRRKYGIEPYVVNCRVCLAPNSPDKPFATFTSVGLFSECCRWCGAKLRLYSSVPRTEEARKEWDEIMGGHFF
jgi:hypothetical protein